MTKRKVDKEMDDKIKNLSFSNIKDLKAALPEKGNSLYIKFLRDLLATPPSEAYSDYLISSFENEAEKDTSLSKLLAKMGSEYTPSEEQSSGSKGKKVRIAYKLENGEIIYVSE